MAHQIDLENFRQIKNLKEELIDILSFLNDFIVKNTEPKKAAYYESVIRYKVDRVCYDLPNIPLSPELFKLVEEIFTKLVEIKEKKKEVYYNSIIRHKVDRVCYIIPNFVLSPKIFELVKEIFLKLVEIKEKKNPINEEAKRINEMYGRFKYLIEWCLLYYEETYIIY